MNGSSSEPAPTPKAPLRLFDAHCHLQDIEPASELDLQLEEAQRAGIAGLHCCGSQEGDWLKVLALAGAHRGLVFGSLGLHPWYTPNRSPVWIEALGGLAAQHAAGIGEIGLDHAIAEFDPNDQTAVFKVQLELSRELRRPASLHCRRAWQAMLDILAPMGPHPAGLVFHSFSGSPEIIPDLVRLNGYFSFSGSLTYPNNKRAARSAMAAPLDRLLIETDAPDLPPYEVRMAATESGPSINRPANLVFVLRRLAALRTISEDEMARITRENAEQVFRPILRCEDNG